MSTTAVPTLRIKRTGRDKTTGTPRYTITLGKLSGTGIQVDELLLMKSAKDILDKANAQGLFYYDGTKATFAAGKVSV
jgi:hypothetical protein